MLRVYLLGRLWGARLCEKEDDGTLLWDGEDVWYMARIMCCAREFAALPGVCLVGRLAGAGCTLGLERGGVVAEAAAALTCRCFACGSSPGDWELDAVWESVLCF